MKLRALPQRGFALITSLLLLIGLMLIGVSAMNMSVTDEKLAGNTAHRNTTYQLAETALRQAETELDKEDPGYILDEPPKVWYRATRNQSGASANGFNETNEWANAKTISIPGAQSSQKVQYQLEVLQPVRSSGDKKSRVFRITARATDSTNNSSVILQTTVMKTLTNAVGS